MGDKNSDEMRPYVLIYEYPPTGNEGPRKFGGYVREVRKQQQLVAKDYREAVRISDLYLRHFQPNISIRRVLTAKTFRAKCSEKDNLYNIDLFLMKSRASP